MASIVSFIEIHKPLAVILILLNSCLCWLLYNKLYFFFNGHIIDAFGGRQESGLTYEMYIKTAREYARQTEVRLWNIKLLNKIFTRNEITAKQCGFSEKSGMWFLLFVRYILPMLMGLITFITNKGDLLLTISIILFIGAVSQGTVVIQKRNRQHEFRSAAYKIYRSLHNQICAGVSIVNALRTVYQVVDDKKLQDQLVLLSATYSRTLNLEKALEDFKSNYDGQEIEGLCTALSQGIFTGDSTSLLEKNEDEMFDQYFNFVEVETERSKQKSKIVICMFVLIIIVMLAVPLLIDIGDSAGKIFVN